MDVIYHLLDAKGKVLDVQRATSPALAVSLKFKGYVEAPPVERKPVPLKGHQPIPASE